MKLKAFLFFQTFLLLFPVFAYSHPHIWVDYRLTFLFDQKGLAGIKHHWTFDEMFTEMMLESHDKNKDKKLSSEETKSLKMKAFNNLKEYGYFNHIKIADKEFQVKSVKDFSASIVNGRLVYEFLVPCRVQAEKTAKVVAVSVFDESFYTDLQPATKTPKVLGPPDRFVVNHKEGSMTFFGDYHAQTEIHFRLKQ